MSIKSIRIILNWSKPVLFVPDGAVSIPEKGGVYEILEQVKEGEKNSLYRRYVGMTDNLSKRFQEHLNEKEPNPCIKKLASSRSAKFDCALLEEEKDRMDTERALYDKYNAQLSCNDFRPPESGRNMSVEIEENNPQ